MAHLPNALDLHNLLTLLAHGQSPVFARDMNGGRLNQNVLIDYGYYPGVRYTDNDCSVMQMPVKVPIVCWIQWLDHMQPKDLA